MDMKEWDRRIDMLEGVIEHLMRKVKELEKKREKKDKEKG